MHVVRTGDAHRRTAPQAHVAAAAGGLHIELVRRAKSKIADGDRRRGVHMFNVRDHCVRVKSYRSVHYIPIRGRASLRPGKGRRRGCGAGDCQVLRSWTIRYQVNDQIVKVAVTG